MEVPDGSLTRFQEQVPKEPLLAARGADASDRHVGWGRHQAWTSQPPCQSHQGGPALGRPGPCQEASVQHSLAPGLGGGRGGPSGGGDRAQRGSQGTQPRPEAPACTQARAERGGTVGPGTWMSKSERSGEGGVSSTAPGTSP